MKVQYFSDLHLEFYKKYNEDKLWRQLQVTSKILCLCGDIGIPYLPLYETFLNRVSELYEKVFIIAGNHEFYTHALSGGTSNGTPKGTISKIREIVWSLPNITFLNNEYEDYMGIRWIGSTLWSDLGTSDIDPKYSTSDLKFITKEEYTSMFKESKEYLTKTIAESTLPVIVLTHHAPSLQLVANKWKGSKWNNWFTSDCEDLIREPVLFWLFGHTHDTIEQEINGVKCLCNPIGYPGEKTPNFTKTIDFTI